MMQNLRAMHDEEPTVEMQLDGTLNLHSLKQEDIESLIPDYLRMCQERGVLVVRIIHGMNQAPTRSTVHSILEDTPEVKSFQLAGAAAGEWATTLVTLQPLDKCATE
jgi:DNA-nicking Smr family endonuclease